MEALLGVLVGGVITLATTIIVDTLRARREHRYRWDDERLETMSEFIAAANRAIGALYDKGTAIAREGESSERAVAERKEARSAVDDLRIARARARLVNPALANSLNQLMERDFHTLRDLAHEGFEGDDPRWQSVHEALQTGIDRICAEVDHELSISSAFEK